MLTLLSTYGARSALRTASRNLSGLRMMSSAKVAVTDIKELREMTGAGMMDCKKALAFSAEQNAGSVDMKTAMDWLREQGMATSSKRADKDASEGLVAMAMSLDGTQAALVEVNSETDFVARNEVFQAFVDDVATTALAHGMEDVQDILSLPLRAGTVFDGLNETVSSIKENIKLRRASVIRQQLGVVGGYMHSVTATMPSGVKMGQIGALVSLCPVDNATESTTDIKALAYKLAMHVTAAKPLFVDRASIPEDKLEEERERLLEEIRQSGKPAAMAEKIIAGKLNRFYADNCLVDQEYALGDEEEAVGKSKKAPTVAQLLKKHGLALNSFTRFQVGN